MNPRMRRKRKRQARRKWFKDNMSSICVMLSFTLVFAFTVTFLFLESKGVMISDTLIEWVFKFFGLEMLALSGIKISKHIGSAFGKLEEAVDGTQQEGIEG